MGTFVTMAAVQFLSYLNVTINFRAIAHQQYLATVVTDAVASALSYFVIRRLQQHDSPAAFWGMVLGGACASVLGLWLTASWGG